ncbi:MAG: hypothetical protein JNK05_21470 [Myxococcales bacterium]|nr:hypothetical protein [Myxococcales bacterium]
MIFRRSSLGWLGSAVVALAAAACSEGGVARSSVDLTQSSGGQAPQPAVYASEQLAFDAVRCVLLLDEPGRARCEEVAHLGGASLDGLLRAEHDAVDRLGELIGRRARSERMTSARRAGLGRWFDLSMAAAREASLANAAARAHHVERLRQDAMRASDLDAVEHAAHLDTRAVRARAQLDALRAFAREGLDGASEAEAMAVVIASARLRGAAAADSAMRAEATQTATDLAVDVAGSSTASVSRERAPADERSAALRAAEGPSIEGARERLAARAVAVCPRAISLVRSLCESSVR